MQTRKNDRAPQDRDEDRPIDTGKEATGDNRRMGDQDGNRTDGASKSPGATDANAEGPHRRG